MKAVACIDEVLSIKTPSSLTAIDRPIFRLHNLQVSVKRDDQIHPVISGNKWRKLKYQLKALLSTDKPEVISFGGAWSNHLHALGYCCYQLSIPLTVFVRGEETHYQSAMIDDLRQWKTEIQWLDRKTYRQKNTEDFLQSLQQQYPAATIIAEGGSSLLAFKGVGELIDELPQDTRYFCLAVGSGGTFAGAALAARERNIRVIGIPVVNDFNDISQRINLLWRQCNELAKKSDKSKNELLQKLWSNSQLIDGYHGGGYAKISPEIASYIKQFYSDQRIMLEPIYVTKLALAVEDLARRGFFAKNSKIVMLHSGGLQGLRGIKKFGLSQWYKENQSMLLTTEPPPLVDIH